MKILVCISKVPDTTTRIRFTDDNTRFDAANVQFIINPLDEFALTRALEIRDQLGGQVEVIHVGGAANEPLIRKALAIGADSAIRVDAEADDSFFIASQIASAARDGGYEMILTGRETIDYNGGSVGAMTGALLGIPFLAGVSKMETTAQESVVEREVEGGKEKVSVRLPFVASVQEGITEPRIPTMKGIMSARTKPLQVKPPSSQERLTVINRYESPPPKAGCVYISPDNPGQLVDLLEKEAKVL